MINIVGDGVKSRMEKYYKDEDVMQRTSKNDSLYEALYKEKQIPRSNVTIFDNVNEIDINKIKTMVDSRENYKRVREYGNIINGIDTYKKSDIEYHFDEIDNSNYDINEIIKNKRSSKLYDSSKVRRITNVEYDIMTRDDKVEEEDDKDLFEIFSTMSRTAIREGTDLFSNLKEEVIEKEKEEVKEEEFYTNTTKFESDDFADDLKESNSSKVFIIIGVIALFVAIFVIVYLKFFN